MSEDIFGLRKISENVVHPSCVICGERTDENSKAEMYNPNPVAPDDNYTGNGPPEPESGIVHPECGLANGWEVT